MTTKSHGFGGSASSLSLESLYLDTVLERIADPMEKVKYGQKFFLLKQ